MSTIGPGLPHAAQLQTSPFGLASDPKKFRSVDEAAKGLEMTFLTFLLKQMRQTLEPDTLFGKDGGDVYGGMFDQFMAQHVVQAGGIGLARSLKHQLGPRLTHGAKPPEPTVSHRSVADPGVR